MNHYFPGHNTSNGNFGFQKKLRDQLCPDSRILVAFNLNPWNIYHYNVYSTPIYIICFINQDPNKIFEKIVDENFQFGN